MRLLAQVPKRLAELEEPEQDNPIRASWHSEKQHLQTKESLLNRLKSWPICGSSVLDQAVMVPGCYPC